MNRTRGFSLVELMIVIAIIAVGITLAMPSFRDLIERKSVGGAAEAAYEQLQVARSQAVKRSKPILVDFNSNGTSWAIGVTDKMRGCNAESTSPLSSCTIEFDNDDNRADAMLMRIQGINHRNITMRPRDGTGFTNAGGVAPRGCTTTNKEQACFDFVRGLARTGAYDFASTNYVLRVRVTQLGNVEVCIPSGEKNIVGYEDC